MENEYKFVSKFIEGKTYKELSAEEIEKLKSGVGVKKEDKEYIYSLRNSASEIEENENNSVIEDNIETAEKKNKDDNNQVEENKNDNEVVDMLKNTNKTKKGMKVIQARGKVLTLEDNKTVTLTKKELEEKTFWRKGDIYYG